MRKNRIREILSRGEIPVGAWIDLMEPHIVEIMGYIGFDFVVLEHEQAARDLSQLEYLITAADAAGISVLVRIRERSPDLVARILGAGAMGIIAAQVESKEDMDNIVRSAKYPPSGFRGMHPTIRSTEFGTSFGKEFANYAKLSNEETMVIGVVETVRGVENVEEIVSTEGLDGVFYGVGDLTLDAGIPGEFDNPRFLDMRDRIVAAAKKFNKLVFSFIIHPDLANSVKSLGADIIIYGHDTTQIRLFYEDVLKQIRNNIEKDK